MRFLTCCLLPGFTGADLRARGTSNNIFLPTLVEPLTNERIKELAHVIINNSAQLLQDLKEHGSCDTGYSLKNACRFRVNIYLESGNYAMVMRHLKPMIPSIDSLKLGPTFQEIIREKNGIVFVTGGTGVGKTTTIAAMLNEINKTRDCHILTLEDPVEFVHTPIKASFSQRELGRDFFDFKKWACAPPCARRRKSFSSAKSATAKRWRSCWARAKPAIWS